MDNAASPPLLPTQEAHPSSNGRKNEETEPESLKTRFDLARSSQTDGPDAVSDEKHEWDLWQAVVYQGPAAIGKTSAEELRQATMRGIPSAIRGVVWQVLAQSKNEELESMYRDLLGRKATRPPLPSRPNSSQSDLSRRSSHAVFEEEDKSLALAKLERSIRRDLGSRTNYSKFLVSSGLQEGLFGVCKSYALFDEDVGYAQGMNFIAMPLLFNMPEEEAFGLFVRLMNNYGLRDMFVADMHGLHIHLYQFERLLEENEPALYCHLHRRGVSPNLYATQWFLTLFAYRFPLQLVLRIYDLVLTEGLTAILRFAIALMQKNAQKLRELQDMAVLTTFLKEQIFDAYLDLNPDESTILESGFFGSASGIDKEVYRANELIQDACRVEISEESLKQFSSEWNKRTLEERERQESEEALRAANNSLSLQVKSLQERCEHADADHVKVASEMVKCKVENQQLRDEVEGLNTRVRELQEIVAAQPGEVEDKLRQEMDRIMKRNIEVQNENRALEESTAEMESELVKAKMKHAEIHEELEGMRKKWSSMIALMGQ